MKKLALAMACLFAVGVAQADDKGGFSQDAAPPPPHKLDDGYRGVEDGRIMTVEQAKTMHDGATVSLRGNLLKRQGDDRYQFRDKSGTITVIIPVAAFNEQHVEPDDLVNINGSLDRKMTPPVVRIRSLASAGWPIASPCLTNDTKTRGTWGPEAAKRRSFGITHYTFCSTSLQEESNGDS